MPTVSKRYVLVRIGRSLWKLFQADLILAVTASEQPPDWLIMSPRGCGHRGPLVHLLHLKLVSSLRLPLMFVHRLWIQCQHFPQKMEFVPTPLLQTPQGNFPDSFTGLERRCDWTCYVTGGLEVGEPGLVPLWKLPGNDNKHSPVQRAFPGSFHSGTSPDSPTSNPPVT
ncbi:hypothetical protein Bbelb_076730 [Branchiostoma belcheri]|nr:hypothetical protein Bbelb_076730 [Branchiostoma belcheri]